MTLWGPYGKRAPPKTSGRNPVQAIGKHPGWLDGTANLDANTFTPAPWDLSLKVVSVTQKSMRRTLR